MGLKITPCLAAAFSLFADEFIAADLTLYSNPLNTALTQNAPPPQKKEEKAGEKKDEGGKEDEEDCVVAADLVKYDSPMAELDRKHKANHK